MPWQLLQPNPYLIVDFLLFAFLTNVAVWKSVAQVNERLPNDQKLSRWWWTIKKIARLWKEHKRLCPNSHWRLYSLLLFLTTIAFMALEFVRSYDSISFGLPRNGGGSAPALVFSRPAQRSLTLRPACSPSRLCDLLHRRLQQLRCLRRCFDCYRMERTSSRTGFLSR